MKVGEGVKVGVSVAVGNGVNVRVGGRNGVSEAVVVNAGVSVMVGVRVVVFVIKGGVGLRVGEGVSGLTVSVEVAVAVTLPGCGANKTATPPRQ